MPIQFTKVHCLFEQSGVFRDAFRNLGYDAFDYDIQNEFGKTDDVIDLFADIDCYNSLDRSESIFSRFDSSDLVFAFFPCIYFCDANTMYFENTSINLDLKYGSDNVARFLELFQRSQSRQFFYGKLLQLLIIAFERGFKLIIENPWDKNGLGYLQRNFPKPSIVDSDRSIRGDYFHKSTAYWFFNCLPTYGFSYSRRIVDRSIDYTPHKQKFVRGYKMCSSERSLVSHEYAKNFINDFILGRSGDVQQTSLAL